MQPHDPRTRQSIERSTFARTLRQFVARQTLLLANNVTLLAEIRDDIAAGAEAVPRINLAMAKLHERMRALSGEAQAARLYADPELHAESADVQQLQETVAQLLGKCAALPSATPEQGRAP